jgi:hypothetical protein
MILGLLAGVIGVAGYIPYIRDILKGTTKPDRASWFIWLLEYTALFAAQVSAGATDSLWLIGLQLVGVVAIALLACKYGVGALDRQSVIILSCVCATLVLWYFSRNANLTILLLVAVESVGVVLTTRKVYRQPGSETLLLWVLIAVAGVLGIAAVGMRAAAILYVYPVALVLMGLSVIVASWLGGRSSARLNPVVELVDDRTNT